MDRDIIVVFLMNLLLPSNKQVNEEPASTSHQTFTMHLFGFPAHWHANIISHGLFYWPGRREKKTKLYSDARYLIYSQSKIIKFRIEKQSKITLSSFCSSISVTKAQSSSCECQKHEKMFFLSSDDKELKLNKISGTKCRKTHTLSWLLIFSCLNLKINLYTNDKIFWGIILKNLEIKQSQAKIQLLFNVTKLKYVYFKLEN